MTTPSSPNDPPPPLVKAVMFTRFEDIEGYVVSASSPPKVMIDQFKDIGYHFLPDRGLCWRMISLVIGDYRMIGVPVHTEDSRYSRRAFVFCFCILIDDENPAGALIAKIAAQNLAETFYHIEIDPAYHLLSDEAIRTSDFCMQSFLDELKSQLNNTSVNHVCLNVIGDYFLEFLKPGKFLMGSSVPVQHPMPWQVPISLVDFSALDKCNTSLLLEPLLSACNGFTQIFTIASTLKVHLSELLAVIADLQQNELVHVINQPIDACTRVRLTPKFHSFFDDLNNKQEAVNYCLMPPEDPQAISAASYATNIGDFVVRMYCRLDGHVTEIGELDSLLRGSCISTRHMVVYGLIKGFLRTKIMYPYFNDYDTTMIPILRLCDGKAPWDAIAYKCRLSRSEFLEQISHHDVLQIWK